MAKKSDLWTKVLDVIRAEQPEIEERAKGRRVVEVMDIARPEVRRKIFGYFMEYWNEEKRKTGGETKLYSDSHLWSRPCIVELNTGIDPMELYNEAMNDGAYSDAVNVASDFKLDKRLMYEAMQKRAEQCAEKLDTIDHITLHGVVSDLMQRGPSLDSEVGKKLAKKVITCMYRDDSKLKPYWSEDVGPEEIAESAKLGPKWVEFAKQYNRWSGKWSGKEKMPD